MVYRPGRLGFSLALALVCHWRWRNQPRPDFRHLQRFHSRSFRGHSDMGVLLQHPPQRSRQRRTL